MNKIFSFLLLILVPVFLHANPIGLQQYSFVLFDDNVTSGQIEPGFMNVITETEYNNEKYIQSGLSNLYKDQNFVLMLLPSQFYSSYNSLHPYGYNDNSLWQGKGVNFYGTSGFVAKYRKNIEITVKPEVSYSQNVHFDLVNSLYDTYEYGYLIKQIDLPQRFGDSGFYNIGWGQSELRFQYNAFTAGIGTQNIWLGPTHFNSLLLSNSAAGFPHLDLGIRKLHTKLGDIEARVFYGVLEESDYFSSDTSDDERVFSLLSVSYTPNFWKEFTIGAHRSIQGNINAADWSFFLMPVDIRMTGGSTDSGASAYGADYFDQRISLTFKWKFPKHNMSFYGEWGRNDFVSNNRDLVQIPSHSQAFIIGGKKIFPIADEKYVALTIEHTNLMQSRSYYLEDIYSSSFFYRHSKSTQGYTHKGQMLGAGIGPGSVAENLELRYVDNNKSYALLLNRHNKDADYVMSDTSTFENGSFFVELSMGGKFIYQFDDFSVEAGLLYLNTFGYNYVGGLHRNGFSGYFSFTLK